MQTTTIKKLLWFAFYSMPFFAFIARGSETRQKIVSPQSAKDSSVPFHAPFAKGHGAQLATETRIPADPPGLHGGKPTAQEVIKGYVRMEAVEHRVDPQLALWIVKHESHFNPRAKGDGEASRGLWQISKIYHPEVSDEVAFNVGYSTDWSLERIRSGKANEWSTYRNCRTLYEDCPF
jgi:hypothetical protein